VLQIADHIQQDTNEKPFSCSCGALFSRRDLLRRHERIEHGSITNSSRQLYTQFTANSVKAYTENTRNSAIQRREILLEGGTALRSDLTSSQPYHPPSQIRCTQHRYKARCDAPSSSFVIFVLMRCFSDPLGNRQVTNQIFLGGVLQTRSKLIVTEVSFNISPFIHQNHGFLNSTV
jgi:hypothetical protein